MTLIAVPDELEAMVARAMDSTDLVALTGGRIAIRRREASETDALGWQMPDHAIVFEGTGGLPGDVDTGRPMALVDVHCYGKTMYEAVRVARYAHAYFCPKPGAAPRSFRTPNCIVWDVVQDGWIVRAYEPVTGYPRASLAYYVQFGDQPPT